MITISNFTKRFGDYTAVKDLSFDVYEGEIFAFLGANGSGKTTTIRTLLGILEADGGRLLINNEPFSHDMSKFIGYLPEERGLYTTSKVLETMAYFGQLKDMDPKQAEQWSTDYLESVGLGDKQQLQIKSLSSGQQQKIQLGIAIINNPKLLILDEPTKGLDPLNRSLLIDKLLELNKQGSTIVFVTHQMEEVERIADRLVMIQDGIRKLYGKVDDVRQQFGSNTIHMRFEGSIPDNSSMYTYRTENKFAEIKPNPDVTANEVLKYLIQKDVIINTFEIESPYLQEIFIQVSGEEKQHV